jgi:hypothetical protein
MDAVWVATYSFGFGPDAFRDIQGSTIWCGLAWHWFILVGGGFLAVWTGVSAFDKLLSRRARS